MIALAVAGGCTVDAEEAEGPAFTGDETEPGTSTDGSLDETTGGASEDEGSEASSSGDPWPMDADYPRPTPLGPEGECPPGFVGPLTFDFDGWVCIPGCTADDPPMCPSGLSGDAEGRCATNPSSSAAPCSDSADCTELGEQCGNIGMGQSGCLLPPSHCILRCDEGQTCPDSMSCSSGSGICQYTI